MTKKNKTILLFGATGMFGEKLYAEAKKRDFLVVGASRQGPDEKIDFLNKIKISELIAKVRPDFIINAAAIVSHSLCDDDPALAYAINSNAVLIMALAAKDLGARLIQISTDNYYSGDGSKLHNENSPVTLTGEYAKTKYAGEIFALSCPKSLVVRTNITGFRSSGDIISFIEWTVNSLESGKQFNLFCDYYASTISTHQAASILLDVLLTREVGHLNIACREVASKKNFVETFSRKVGLSLDKAKIISVHDVLSARSESIGLDVTRAETLLGYKLPTLNEVVDQLAKEYLVRKKPI